MKKIYEMSVDEMVKELVAFCHMRGECKRCELSLINRLGFEADGHDAFNDITDRHLLVLMVAIARGYLVWADRKELDNGSNVPEQPTVPPMPEPVKSVTSRETELTVSMEGNLLVDGYADATQIVISGKKPTMMTIYFDEPAD